ncbi:MAG TPA: GMC family oxidoreductase [Methylomirabilota bacterium]|nr:GMC family oxidoreductase [Methylomirabilota bacterium]
MFIDAHSIAKDATLQADICIIGAGAAGITLALEFIGQPVRVCVLESGGLDSDERTQSLSTGENIGLAYLPLETTRSRQFGGSLAGAGWFCPLDEIDFEKRKWIPYSGWPFAKSHLDPFYDRAQRILRLGSFMEEAEIRKTDNRPVLPFASDNVITKMIRIGPPIHFGKLYQSEIEPAVNIQTYLYANVVRIETNDKAETVTRLRVACLEGNKFWVSARLYILAAGGIENARLLLLSNKTQQNGLGNQNDLVGRFFMEHPHFEAGRFIPADSHIFRTLHRVYNTESTSRIRALGLADQTLRREKLLNFSATFELEPYELATGATSLKLLMESLRRRKIPDDPLKHLYNVVFNMNDVAVAACKELSNKLRRQPKYLRFYNRLEQSPNPDSRVSLSENRDIFGRQTVRLDWRISSEDRSSVRRATEMMDAELKQAGLGSLKTGFNDGPSWPPSLTGGHHHMGTTRMHPDAKSGVVNEHCRLHGTLNLFVAGSSVFPTSGCANPTLTIIALALRLADHVKNLLQSGV